MSDRNARQLSATDAFNALTSYREAISHLESFFDRGINEVLRDHGMRATFSGFSKPFDTANGECTFKIGVDRSSNQVSFVVNLHQMSIRRQNVGGHFTNIGYHDGQVQQPTYYEEPQSDLNGLMGAITAAVCVVACSEGKASADMIMRLNQVLQERSLRPISYINVPRGTFPTDGLDADR